MHERNNEKIEKSAVILNVIEHSHPIKQTEISFHMMVVAAEAVQNIDSEMLKFELTHV